MEDVVEIPGDEAGWQVACRNAKTIRVNHVWRKEPLLNRSRELELLLRELRFFQAFDTFAQALLEQPEEVERKTDDETGRARHGECDAEVARGEGETNEPHPLGEQVGYDPGERAAEKKTIAATR